MINSYSVAVIFSWDIAQIKIQFEGDLEAIDVVVAICILIDNVHLISEAAVAIENCRKEILKSQQNELLIFDHNL